MNVLIQFIDGITRVISNMNNNCNQWRNYLEAGGSSSSGFVGQGQSLVVLVAVGRRRRRIRKTLALPPSFADFQTEKTQWIQNNQ